MSGGPSIGAQIACIVQFVVMMTLLGPILSLCSGTGSCIIPPAQRALYFGTNGLLNVTGSNFNSQLVSPLSAGANSSSGFGASVQQFGGLAFIYGAFGAVWKSFTNSFILLYIIFTSLTSSIDFLPVTIGAIASIGILSYITISNFLKFLSLYMKSDAENVGS